MCKQAGISVLPLHIAEGSLRAPVFGSRSTGKIHYAVRQTVAEEREEDPFGRIEVMASLVDEEKVVEVRGFVVTCSASRHQSPEARQAHRRIRWTPFAKLSSRDHAKRMKLGGQLYLSHPLICKRPAHF